MLSRTTSSRRRRASRSAASSPAQTTRVPGTRSAATSPGRRASIAVSPIDSARSSNGLGVPDLNRSPRHSIIPDIALMETKDDSFSDHLLENKLSNRSPRHSLVPSDSSAQRSPRHSLVPNDNRSPRNSLVPDSALSPRNSLTPDQYNRSPRNSLVPDQNRSPRHSLTPDSSNVYGSRLSILEYNRSPRNSLVPSEGSTSARSPRQSISGIDTKITWNNEEVSMSRNPRHSVISVDRSPRGSIIIAPESFSYRTSPRGSITGGSVAGDYASETRNSRACSISHENGYDPNRSPRGSIARNNLTSDLKNSRGSLTLTFQEPPVNESRRFSSDNNPSNSRGKNTSPSSYRSSSRGNINMGYGSHPGLESGGSRRASSSVSQVGISHGSDSEQRKLCGDQKYSREMGQGLSLGLTLTSYGSVAYQLKDANFEANTTCDFVFKAMRIVNKTIMVTVLLVCLSIVPLIMLIMGVQYLRDCPKEPNIPIYMVVGGSIGSIKMGLCLWNQLHIRHIEPSASNESSIASKVASIALTIFLITWFGLGNYWILHIKYPDYVMKLFDPNKWCHRTLYVFALVHLWIVYSVFGVIIVLVIVLAFCHIFGCQWLGPARYK